MRQPVLINLVLAATNKPISTTRKLATAILFRSRKANATVRIGFSTFAHHPEPGVFTEPATLDATNSIVIDATADLAAEWLLKLSDGEIERGEYYDLSQIYANGTAAQILEVLYEPVGPINR